MLLRHVERGREKPRTLDKIIKRHLMVNNILENLVFNRAQ